MERVEAKSGASSGQVLALMVLFHIISSAVNGWLAKPIALGAAAFAAALISYRFSPHRRIGFLKWALGGLLLVVGYVGLVYGVFYPLRKPIGPVLTAGLGAFVVSISFRFVPDSFLGLKPKDGLWK